MSDSECPKTFTLFTKKKVNNNGTVQRKQVCYKAYKTREAFEFEVLDELSESEIANQNRISTESDDDLEEDAHVSNLSESEEDDAEPPIPLSSALSTPSYSPPVNRRGPRTPSFSPPVNRRGPITPPTFPFEDSSSDSSFKEIQVTNKRSGISFYNLRKRHCTQEATQTSEELHVDKLMQGLTEMLQSGQHSDVTLIVCGKEFRAHRPILSAHSPVFNAMLTYDTKEKVSGIIIIEDIDPDTFAAFLNFMYSGKVQNLNLKIVLDLYTVADKYEVKDLCNVCLMYMMDHISLETFCDIMTLSLRHHEKTLSEKAADYFFENAEDILKTPEWLMFMKDNSEAGKELMMKAI